MVLYSAKLIGLATSFDVILTIRNPCAATKDRLS